jgi:hypothetical protein
MSAEADPTCWPPWPERGQIYRDPIGGAVVLVLAAPSWHGVLRCSGIAMVASRPLPCGYHSRYAFGTALRPGLRYCDVASGLQVRCLRAGAGHLTYAGQPLACYS